MPSLRATRLRVVSHDTSVALPASTMSLRFDQGSFNDVVSGNDLITRTRASTALYWNGSSFLTAGVDESRLAVDPETGRSGVLVEEARTNTINYWNSSTAGQTWVNVGTHLSSTAGAADFMGGNDANTAADAVNTTGESFYQKTSAGSFAAGTTVTYSVWILPVALPASVFGLQMYANGTADGVLADFNVSNDTVGLINRGTGSGAVATSVTYPGGWRRYSITGIVSTVTMADTRVRITIGSYARVSGTTRFLWYGSQLEEGGTVTTPIPTTGAAATRAQDVLTITGTNFSDWYNQTEGTFVAKVLPFPSDTERGFFSASQDNSNFMRLSRQSPGNEMKFEVVSSAVTQASLVESVAAPSRQPTAVATAYKADDVALSEDGRAVITDTSATLPSPVELQIGRANLLASANCIIESISYWPIRFSDNQLVQVSSQ